tara:strand:- start:1168 stop:2052 length:885 start_codon:yes stop_codon:yes gene_type:complete
MITLHKSKYRESNELKFVSDDGLFVYQNFDLKIKEMRETSWKWIVDSSSLPEKMFQLFRRHVKNLSETKSELIFIDIGAAEGAFSCSVIEYFKNFNITLFEPDYPRLCVCIENLKTYLNKHEIDESDVDIDIYEHIVSDGEKETELLRHYTCLKQGGHAGSSRLFKADREDRLATDLEFEATKLDNFIDSYNKVDIIKIDVEGAEIKVLKGANKFIDKFKPIIYLEIHGDEENGSITLEQVKEVFDEYDTDYRFKFIEAHHHHRLAYTTVEVGIQKKIKVPFLDYYLLSPIREK